jgi:hypothetical protein
VLLPAYQCALCTSSLKQHCSIAGLYKSEIVPVDDLKWLEIAAGLGNNDAKEILATHKQTSMTDNETAIAGHRRDGGGRAETAQSKSCRSHCQRMLYNPEYTNMDKTGQSRFNAVFSLPLSVRKLGFSPSHVSTFTEIMETEKSVFSSIRLQ